MAIDKLDYDKTFASLRGTDVAAAWRMENARLGFSMDFEQWRPKQSGASANAGSDRAKDDVNTQ